MGYEIIVQFVSDKLHGVPDLVAEMPVRDYSFDVQVDVPPLSSVRAETEPHRVRPALGDSIWEVLVLTFARLGYFFRVQVPTFQLLVECLGKYIQ